MQTLIVVVAIVGFQSVAYSQASAPTTQNAPMYGMPASPPNPAQACLVDICGTPAQANVYMTKYSDRLNEYVRLAADPKQIDYPPAVAKLFADIQVEDRAQYTKAIAIFRQSTPLGDARPQGLSKAMYNIISLSPHLRKIKYKANVVNGKTEVVIDEPATLAEFKDVAPADRSWATQVAKSFLSAYKVGSVSEGEIQTQPVQFVLRKLYPDLSLSAAMKLEVERAQAKIKSLKDLSSLEKAIFFNNTTPDRIALIAGRVADGTVDETESREVLLWNVESARSESYYRDPKSPLLTREPPPIEEIIKQAGGVEAIAKAFEADRTNDRQKDESKIQMCKMQYFINKGLLPSKAQVEALKRDVERGKQLVIDMIKSKFPTAAQAKLIKAVERADFVAPPSVGDFERSFESSLRQKLTSASENSKAMTGIPAAEIRQLISVFSMAKKMEDPKESKDSSNSYCDAFKYSPMSDANYTTYGSILLSFSTATGDETSRMKTIMHELGHSVSKAIADDPTIAERFRGVKRCLNDQHTEVLPTQTKKLFDEMKKTNPKADAPYVEEDFADSVAGESGRGIQGKNGWCQFLSLTPDRQQFVESTMQAVDGDPHSADLFRLLNFEKMKKGRLPDSCGKFLASTKYKENFSQCLDLANPNGRSTQPARTVN